MNNQLTELVALRKELHRFPELSGQERATAKKIKQFLLPFSPTQIIENIGGFGLIALFDFGENGSSIAIRCELDALPIQEKNEFEHQSINTGISHKCGHDGHMTIVAGLADFLQNTSFIHGKVYLLFQPAEENGQGAKAMLDEMTDIHFDYVFALHNLPSYPKHEIIVFPNQFSATVQSVAISLEGKTAHAAEPENGINPALAISEIIQFAKSLEETDPNTSNFQLLTPVFIEMGQKDYGISAGRGEVHFTIRAWTVDKMEVLLEDLKGQIEVIAKHYQLNVSYEWFDYFPTAKNSDLGNQLIQESAKSNNFNTTIANHGCKFGEDFGWFSQKYKSTMFGLGAGKHCPALHHDDYDFPDELISTGIDMFKEIIHKILV